MGSHSPSTIPPVPRLGSSPERRGWRRVGFPVMAILLGLAPFVLLEAALHLCDVGHPRRYVDPFVGFSRLHPLFELDEQYNVYRTTRARRLAFGTQEFSAEKPAGGYRVFCLGGSTVRGHPYETDTAFPHWLDIELNETDSTRRYEVVNCGGVSYASYRLMPVLEEVLDYQPDLIIVASGHNEFLEDRTYHHLKTRGAIRTWVEDRVYSLRTITLARQLWQDEGGDGRPPADERPDGQQPARTILPAEVDTRLDSRSGYASYHRDDEWRTQVIAHYDQTIRAMVQACGRAGVPLVLVNLGENLRDCPPFKSEHRAVLDTGALQAWQAAFDRATAAETGGDLETALDLYRQVEAIDPEYALLAYRIARCLDRLGRCEEALRYYIRSKELDVCPLRMLEPTHEALRTIAAETDTPLLDARELLERHSPDEIVGNDWYVDHVHPTIGGHQKIAQALAALLRQREQMATGNAWNERQRRAAYRNQLRTLGPAYLSNGYRRVGWLEGWARRNRLFDETLPRDAGAFLRYGHRLLEFGLEQEAWDAYRAALTDQPALSAGLFDRAFDLFQQGRPEAARAILDGFQDDQAAVALPAEWAWAALVVAVETGDRSKVTELYAAHPDVLHPVQNSPDRWQTAMPDVKKRAAELLDDDHH